MTIFKMLHAPHTCSRYDLLLLNWGRPSSHISFQIWPVAFCLRPHVPKAPNKNRPGASSQSGTNNSTKRNIPQMHHANTN